jgi:hypothetical protein
VTCSLPTAAPAGVCLDISQFKELAPCALC